MRCLHISIFIEIPSLEGLPTKTKEDPFPHEMRLPPAGHQPSISWSWGLLLLLLSLLLLLFSLLTLLLLFKDLTTRDSNFTILVEIFTNHILAEKTFFTNHTK